MSSRSSSKPRSIPLSRPRPRPSSASELRAEGAKLGVSQGAMVVMDGGGAVLAMVGGRSYRKSQFNRVTKAKRQPGSAFKPFVFLAALERGYTPDTVEVDEPVRIGNWTPENYRKKYLGPVTLETALALSLNTVAAKLAVQVGPRGRGRRGAPPRHRLEARQRCLAGAWHIRGDAARTHLRLRALLQRRLSRVALRRHPHPHARRARGLSSATARAFPRPSPTMTSMA